MFSSLIKLAVEEQKLYQFLCKSYDMVEIIFDPSAPYSVSIIRNWKDHRDYLYALGIFLLAFTVFGILAWINNYPSKKGLLIWIGILIILFFWFFLPSKYLIMDLDKDRWKIQIGIWRAKISLESGKLTDIEYIQIEEVIRDNRDSSKKLTLNIQEYTIKFQLIGFKSMQHKTGKILKVNESEKKVEFIRNTTFNFRAHLVKLKDYTDIAKTLTEFFQGLEIPIDLIYERNVYQNGELISANN
ncbi:MAG: hypothetical protein DRO88_09320 [Promethearchaeia archaeon]|nr:MAG: hypothetical protein DRO88_09320 [Candidatus Lokiarchaeia archaeon]